MRIVLTAMGDMDESTKNLLRSLAGSMVVKTVESAANAAFRAAQGVMDELKKLPESTSNAIE